MKRSFMAILIVLELLLTGCTSELRTNTRAIGATITDLQTAQIQDNITSFYNDYFSIPSQYEIGNGNSATNHLITAGASPFLAFRAVAFTGLAVSDANQISQGWALSPVIGVTDLRRLQVLYQYAVGPDRDKTDKFCSDQKDRKNPEHPSRICSYEQLVKQLGNLFYIVPRAKDGTTQGSDTAAVEFYRAVQTVAGELPLTPPLIAEGRECNEEESEKKTSWKVDDKTFCFRKGLTGENCTRSGPHTGEHCITLDPVLVRDRFKLWIAASTQRLQKEEKTRTVVKNGKKTVITTDSFDLLRKEPSASFSSPGSLATVPQ